MPLDVTELRTQLFETMKDLRNSEKPMEIERALAIAQVGQVIVNSAKTEVEYMKIAGGQGSGFIPTQLPAPAGGKEPPVRQHRLR